MSGAASMPIAVAATSTRNSRVPIASTSERVSSALCRFRYSDSIGTKACEKAPSANMRRSRFGMRKATKNASVARPAPKKRAMKKSRA